MKTTAQYQALLEGLTNILNKRGVSVELTNDTKDEVGIAELQNNKIIVNTSTRDILGVIITIAHLFGHMVQFMNYDKYKHLVETVDKPKPLILDDSFKKEFYEYELEAFRIGKGLIQELEPFDDELEHRYQNYMQTDFEHFWYYITTGKKGEIEHFNLLLEENYEKMRDRPITALESLPAPMEVSFVGQKGQVD